MTPEEMEDKSRKAAKNKDIRSFFGSKKSRNGGDQDERRKIDSGLLMSPGVSVTATRCDGNYRAEERDRPTSNSNIPNIIHEQMVCGYVAARRDRTGKRVGQSLPSEDDSTFLDLTPQELDTSIPPSSQPVQSSTGKTEGIFSDLTIYINGSTFPLISDHKLKNILAENGANISIHLARRSVTHVILGRPNSRSENLGVAGAGGGLAARKLQREIQRVSGKGVKYVGVEW